MSKYIDVALNIPLNTVFTYFAPKEEESSAAPFGRRVEVRFGNRKMTGFVVSSSETRPKTCTVEESKIREATRYIYKEPLITEEIFNLAKWISYFYVSPIGETLFAMTPSGRREVSFGGTGTSFDEDKDSYIKRTLSAEQESAVEGILKTSQKKLFHYLYGTTGSGKTEVFLSVAENILKEDKGVIYLVPEIALTPQVVEAVIERFGQTAAVLHSSLTPSQRLSEWNRILKREARIVIGARSAIFAPVPELGLIIIDEEHDASYKAGSSPRYHARQVAMKRSATLKIPLIMGSATPSVEAWHAMKTGGIVRHTLTKRLAGGAEPTIDCVNLSLHKGSDCISLELSQEIKKTLLEKRQVILFMNRRGFTHFFRCNFCGFELKCKNCSVSLTYHKKENRLKCHYCGYSVQPPMQCPQCGSLDVGYSGFGTEYIEAEVRAKFPLAKTLRIDTDSLSKKGELAEKINSFRNGEYDILLGTQMIAKGLNFPNLKLVGVVLADTALHLPDFRANERTFALITQVAGRAGRFFPDGRVIVQSFSPDREPIALSVSGEIEKFYNNELEQRNILGFPPFTRLARLVFRSQNKKETEKASFDAYKILKANIQNGVDILGPAECPLEMVSNNYRMNIILRGKDIGILIKMVNNLIWGYTHSPNVYIEVDIDPVSML